MSDIANYTFLPWLRHGIANEISGQSNARATIAVNLELSGETLAGDTVSRPPIARNIEIYGPGDIIGVEQSAIIKVEPRNWITNFEPNYLPYIEFYDEDFPWRYSPVTPNGHRLLPWISLIVLKEDEFTNGKNIKDRPLPYINLKGAQLPPSDQLWAWSHVHINKNIIDADIKTTNAADIQSKLTSTLKADPDFAYSRIVSPRKLEPNTAYHVFLAPVFETGLFAGRGEDPAQASAFDALAWTAAQTPPDLPYYYRWYFRTASIGDFEYLVRLLKPQPIDNRVGLREMDVQSPGANIRGIVDAPGAPENQKLGGVLKLGGALKVPDAFYAPEELAVVNKFRNWPAVTGYPHAFQKDLAAFINLTDAYEQTSAAVANSASGVNEEQSAGDPETEYDITQNPDPLITAPLYGRWHALTQRLLKERDGSDMAPNDNWAHELNLDPQWRVPAGFGTKIIQEHQERFMKAAWEQVGDVLEANKRIRAAQLAKEVSWIWHTAHIDTLRARNAEKWLALSAPLHTRVVNQGFTVRHQIHQSKVPGAVLAPPMRKALKSRGRLRKRLRFDAVATPDNLLNRLNDSAVNAAPPRKTPELNTVQDVADSLKRASLPAILVNLLERFPWIKWAPLFIALLLVLLLFIFAPSLLLTVTGGIVVAGLVVAYLFFNVAAKQIDRANRVLGRNQTPDAIDALPKSADFRLSTPEDNITPTIGGNTDSEEGVRFKQALKDANFMLQESIMAGFTPARLTLDLPAISGALFQQLNPQVTIPNWVRGIVTIPPRLKGQLPDDCVEVMAYPEIDEPMYKPLADLSAELFLPNINYVEQNSISLLETNQKFIESYMVGLNHEFARELLWRAYMTDQRGSYFRQFWEAQGYHDDQTLSADELKEKLKDIPPIHKWLKRSKLGDHDHREQPGDNEEEVVLVIRGELLKRYPNAIIYAHRAAWRDDTDDGEPIVVINSGQTIDLRKERTLWPISPAEDENPPRSIVKTPLYEAKVDPDIYFFGFDLTVCKAKGGTGKESDPVDALCAAEGVHWRDAGWFFVIKERFGEISMGLDVADAEVDLTDVKVWNDLSWRHVTPPVQGGGFLQINDQTQDIDLQALSLPQEAEKQEQKLEDEAISWTKNMSAAELAYVLYQVPVLVAVHASEMLPKQ